MNYFMKKSCWSDCNSHTRRI